MKLSNYKHLARQSYTWLCRSVIKKDKLTSRIVYLASFPQDISWLKNVASELEVPIYLYVTSKAAPSVQNLQDDPNFIIKPLAYHWAFWQKDLSFIYNSQIILADNYFPFFGAFTKRAGQHIVQLWHANGAIKKFGLEDPKVTSTAERRLHHKVYQAFTDYVVGSDIMGDIFMNAYGATAEQLIKIGYPRSDLYHHSQQAQLKEQFLALNPQYRKQELWLYAPTYRLNNDYPNVRQSLAEQNVTLIEMYHPSSSVPSTNYQGSQAMLLAAIDCLITDYSSLPFDYANLHPNGKIIYFQYDQAEYELLYGLQSFFMNQNQQPIVKTISELQREIKQTADMDLTSFNQIWNQYNDGYAAKRLGQLLHKWLKEVAN